MRNQTKTAGTAQEITDFWYDPNGNQISSMTISTGGTDVAGAGIALVGADNTSSYSEYNSWNQLTKTMQNGKTSSYTYNGDGLRMSKTVNGVTTSHIWDGTNIAADASGSTVTKYIRGLQLISSKKSSNESFYTYNGHGDVVQLTDDSGSITKKYSYDAFGVEIDKADNDTNPFRYCGEYYDTETDSVYLRARYYRPTTGRFITEDPYWNTNNMIYGNSDNKYPDINAITQSSVLYVYCNGNPIKNRDPNGTDYPDYWRIQKKYGWSVANSALSYANLALNMAQNYAYNHGLNSDWNNEADAYRHFMWNAMLTRHVGYYQARFITNLHEYMAMEDYGWLDTTTRFTTTDSPWVYGRMNQESFMDLWNNQVGRELANNKDFSHMNGDELFAMALENNWLITSADNVFEFLGISDCISNYDEYTVDVAWNQDTGNITVYKNGGAYVTLKIGV